MLIYPRAQITHTVGLYGFPDNQQLQRKKFHNTTYFRSSLCHSVRLLTWYAKTGINKLSISCNSSGKVCPVYFFIPVLKTELNFKIELSILLMVSLIRISLSPVKCTCWLRLSSFSKCLNATKTFFDQPVIISKSSE